MLQRVSPHERAPLGLVWRGLRRRLLAVGQGLATHGAAASAHEHQAVAGALRAHQIRPRRIAVMGATGGVGTTTAAVLLAGVVSAARDDQTLLLTPHCDASDGAARLSLTHAPSITAVLAGLRRDGRIPPTAVTLSGVRVLAAPAPGAASPGPGLAALLDVAAAGHACVVIDAGVAGQIADLPQLLDLVDTVVLVCATTPAGLHATSSLFTRVLASATTGAAAPRVLVLPVHTRPRTVGRGIDPVACLRPPAGAAHLLPHDGELARGRTIDVSTLSGPALTAVLTLAADIMGHR